MAVCRSFARLQQLNKISPPRRRNLRRLREELCQQALGKGRAVGVDTVRIDWGRPIGSWCLKVPRPNGRDHSPAGANRPVAPFILPLRRGPIQQPFEQLAQSGDLHGLNQMAVEAGLFRPAPIFLPAPARQRDRARSPCPIPPGETGGPCRSRAAWACRCPAARPAAGSSRPLRGPPDRRRPRETSAPMSFNSTLMLSAASWLSSTTRMRWGARNLPARHRTPIALRGRSPREHRPWLHSTWLSRDARSCSNELTG